MRPWRRLTGAGAGVGVGSGVMAACRSSPSGAIVSISGDSGTTASRARDGGDGQRTPGGVPPLVALSVGGGAQQLVHLCSVARAGTRDDSQATLEHVGDGRVTSSRSPIGLAWMSAQQLQRNGGQAEDIGLGAEGFTRLCSGDQWPGVPAMAWLISSRSGSS